jgi:ArpU family phage transcriptional regulator
MDWKKSAIEDLRNYNRRKDSLDNIKQRIRALKEVYASVKCSLGSDPVAVKGGGSKIEDRMLDNIVERKRLSHTYNATKQLVELTEKGLGGLDERERRVLELFFIAPQKGSVARLMEELGYEQRQIYKIKDQALYSFTIMQYGLADY